ncbi:hypothetical protein [Pseudodesulfovibrio senegalensis]|uniref:Secreted protein n=1 Tax=Pseudodesulfovibrio senegalensis TaxID=1721087 RepID=A0A6N6N5X7_9BACT|nr:hypothetical protein [Pseudodesulfovibrio senegalensis]KAB1443141.1 hypothetical protein F8A88_02435 [Pseudodesulfovibrio senegalensis]
MKPFYALLVVIALSSFAAVAQAQEDPYVGSYSCSGDPQEGCGFYGGTIYPISNVVVTKAGDRYKFCLQYQQGSDSQTCKKTDIVNGQAKWKGSRMLVPYELEFFNETTVTISGSSIKIEEKGVANGDAGVCDLTMQAICTE